MRFRYFSIAFTLALWGIAAWAIWEARKWSLQSSLMPWVIGFPTLVLLTVQLVRESVAKEQTGPETDNTEAPALDASLLSSGEASADPIEERRRTASIILWILGFALAIWLLGFHLGTALSAFLYLKLEAWESWMTSVVVAVVMFAFSLLFFDCTMHIFFGEGEVFAYLGLGVDAFYSDVCQRWMTMVK